MLCLAADSPCDFGSVIYLCTSSLESEPPPLVTERKHRGITIFTQFLNLEQGKQNKILNFRGEFGSLFLFFSRLIIFGEKNKHEVLEFVTKPVCFMPIQGAKYSPLDAKASLSSWHKSVYSAHLNAFWTSPDGSSAHGCFCFL